MRLKTSLKSYSKEVSGVIPNSSDGSMFKTEHILLIVEVGIVAIFPLSYLDILLSVKPTFSASSNCVKSNAFLFCLIFNPISL